MRAREKYPYSLGSDVPIDQESWGATVISAVLSELWDKNPAIFKAGDETRFALNWTLGDLEYSVKITIPLKPELRIERGGGRE